MADPNTLQPTNDNNEVRNFQLKIYIHTRFHFAGRHLFFINIDFSIVFDFKWFENASDRFLFNSGRFRPSVDCKGIGVAMKKFKMYTLCSIV